MSNDGTLNLPVLIGENDINYTGQGHYTQGIGVTYEVMILQIFKELDKIFQIIK
jgi:hypothetical protein